MAAITDQKRTIGEGGGVRSSAGDRVDLQGVIQILIRASNFQGIGHSGIESRERHLAAVITDRRFRHDRAALIPHRPVQPSSEGKDHIGGSRQTKLKHVRGLQGRDAIRELCLG